MAAAPGVTWQVSSESAWEQQHIAALGETECRRRLALAEAKIEELRAVAEWEEVCIMGPQFRSIIMQLSAANVAKWPTIPPRRLANLIYKLAGV